MNTNEREAIRKELIAEQEAKEVSYIAIDGQEIKLSIERVRKYLCADENITNKEAMTCLQLCKLRQINPFIGDVHIIKFGTMPAQLIVGKYHFIKVARKHSDYLGFAAGIFVKDSDGKLEKRVGTIVLDGEILIGGWCNVFVEGKKDFYADVQLKEYIKKKKDGSPNAMWKEKPATMIRKVAIVQSLREAYPDELSGIHDASEIGAMSHGFHDVDESSSDDELESLILSGSTTIDGETGEIIQEDKKADKKVDADGKVDPKDIPFD